MRLLAALRLWIGGTLSIVVGGAKNILDIDKLLSAISGAAAGSWQMKNRLEAVHQREFNFGFAIKWMVKYFSYALNKANKNNLNLELTKNVYNKYQQLIKNGKENYDISALILHRDK